MDPITVETIGRFEDRCLRSPGVATGKLLAGLIEASATVHVFDEAGNLVRTSDGTPGFFGAGVDVRGRSHRGRRLPEGRPDLAANRVTLRGPAKPDQTRVLPAAGMADPLTFDPSGDRLAPPSWTGVSRSRNCR